MSRGTSVLAVVLLLLLCVFKPCTAQDEDPIGVEAVDDNVESVDPIELIDISDLPLAVEPEVVVDTDIDVAPEEVAVSEGGGDGFLSPSSEAVSSSVPFDEVASTPIEEVHDETEVIDLVPVDGETVGDLTPDVLTDDEMLGAPSVNAVVHDDDELEGDVWDDQIGDEEPFLIGRREPVDEAEVLEVDSIPIKPVEVDETVDPAESDPRLGICTIDELDSVKDFFSTNEHQCAAYQCVGDKTQIFFESLLTNYPSLWSEGGDAKVNSVASLLAACTCRCDMMKCEVDFIENNASSKCFDATVDYCDAQNELFVERCSAASDEYPVTVVEKGQGARWKSSCPNACRPRTDPVDGLAMPETVVSEVPETEGEAVGAAEEVTELIHEDSGEAPDPQAWENGLEGAGRKSVSTYPAVALVIATYLFLSNW
eukprot:GHVQ01036091.1.p1 GENE.GHVQ01036091.1~~GHVQ01036091.1.p1  ORF type:complete len:426 (+),score=94.99 GHVQ01036091.1:280-1557(+)